MTGAEGLGHLDGLRMQFGCLPSRLLVLFSRRFIYDLAHRSVLGAEILSCGDEAQRRGKRSKKSLAAATGHGDQARSEGEGEGVRFFVSCHPFLQEASHLWIFYGFCWCLMSDNLIAAVFEYCGLWVQELNFLVDLMGWSCRLQQASCGATW